MGAVAKFGPGCPLSCLRDDDYARTDPILFIFCQFSPYDMHVIYR